MPGSPRLADFLWNYADSNQTTQGQEVRTLASGLRDHSSASSSTTCRIHFVKSQQSQRGETGNTLRCWHGPVGSTLPCRQFFCRVPPQTQYPRALTRHPSQGPSEAISDTPSNPHVPLSHSCAPRTRLRALTVLPSRMGQGHPASTCGRCWAACALLCGGNSLGMTCSPNSRLDRWGAVSAGLPEFLSPT